MGAGRKKHLARSYNFILTSIHSFTPPTTLFASLCRPLHTPAGLGSPASHTYPASLFPPHLPWVVPTLPHPILLFLSSTTPSCLGSPLVLPFIPTHAFMIHIQDSYSGFVFRIRIQDSYSEFALMIRIRDSYSLFVLWIRIRIRIRDSC